MCLRTKFFEFFNICIIIIHLNHPRTENYSEIKGGNGGGNGGGNER